MRIAALVASDGRTSPVDGSGAILVFECPENDDIGGVTGRRTAQWRCIAEIPYPIHREMTLSEIRRTIHSLAPHLSGVRTLLVRRSMGIFTAIFEEELLIPLLPLQGPPAPALNAARDHILGIHPSSSPSDDDDAVAVIPRPTPVGHSDEGRYRIDLVEIQANHRTLTTKDILRPFLRDTSFNDLEIICHHIPKWIEADLLSRNYRLFHDTTPSGAPLRIHLRPPDPDLC